MNKAIKKGFTLVELVIVIAVIAVLSAVLIPVFGNVVKDARVSSLKASLKVCTQNLMLYAAYNQVDYYTPAVIRDFLESEGIKGLTSDDSEFCEDGYSIWYNQENFNLSLVKNEDLASYVASGSPSAGVSGGVATYSVDIFGNLADATQTVGTDIGASSQLKKLPRRPEALTANENLLLLATDESNKSALEAIETMYNGLDKTQRNPTGLIQDVQHKLKFNNCDILERAGWSDDDYVENFNPKTTAWLTEDGTFVTGAEFIKSSDDAEKVASISNVIVSRNLGATMDVASKNQIEGNIKDENGNDVKGKLDVSCVIELATTNSIEVGSSFGDRFAGSSVNILVSGNVSVGSFGATTTKVSTSTVSTVTGGGRNITSAVTSGGGSAVAGGGSKVIKQTISAAEFAGWTTKTAKNDQKLVTYSNVSTRTDKGNTGTVVSVKTADGMYVEKVLDNEAYKNYFTNPYVDDSGTAVRYKYNTTSFAINVSGCLEELGIIGENDNTTKITVVNVYDENINNVKSTNVYIKYEKDGVIGVKTINFGVGYINSFDHYYRYYKEGFDSLTTGENLTPTYFAIKDELQTKNAGSLAVKLPDGALNLQSYKSEDFTIEVWYQQKTDYYKEKTSDFGLGSYYVLTESVLNSPEKCLTWKKDYNTDQCYTNSKLTDGSYLFEFGDFMQIEKTKNYTSNKSEAPTYFVNTVQINRIIIKDKDGNVLIAKYPTVAETASGTTSETTETTSGSAA